MPETKVPARHTGFCAKSKSGDESVTSSTTVQNDDHLIVPIGANETMLLTYDLFFNIGASTNFKFKLSLPSGASAGGHVKHGTASTATEVSDFTAETTVTTSPFSGTNNGHIVIHAKVVSSSTPGNITLQWAQGTSSGTALTLKSRSKVFGARE